MKLKRISWEEQYKADMESGVGFQITNPVSIDNKTAKKTVDGIFSSKYGADDVSSITELYSCECKALKGHFFEGMVCEECGTEVKYHNNNIETTGWISLNDYYLINPLFFNLIAKVIGTRHLNDMLRYNKEIDKDGNIVVNLDDVDETNPYCNIGIVEFREKFDEIMQYCHDNMMKPDKEKIYQDIMANKDKIFSRHVPVYSLTLRPVMIYGKSVVYTDINRKYALLIANADSLNRNDTNIDIKEIKVLPCLYETQMIINEIHSMIINVISGKKGHIRNSMLGCRVNYSSRCVIVPLIGKYRTNELIIPYLCFLELYKFEIINLLSKMDKITIIEANNRWRNAQNHFDKRIYLIMKYILKNTKGGVKVLINRK